MTYNKEFFLERRMRTLVSAEHVLEHLWKVFQPNSVLDVGCATGIWLAECKRKGAKNISGIDGPWVPKDELEISKDEFIECDFGRSLPSDVGKHELALCIEVAEHIPQSAESDLIDFLTSRADVVLFSAAIAGQGGTGHVNERQQSYWFECFHRRGYECFDLIRPLVWNDESTNVIYKQNMLLYVRSGSVYERVLLSGGPKVQKVSTAFELDRVHPDLFLMRSGRGGTGLVVRAKKYLGRVADLLSGR